MFRNPKRGHFSRSRSLEDFNKKFGENIVENTINEAIIKEKNVRILEIGCGEGRVLMQIRKLFPDIEIYGINRKPWIAMKGSKSLKRTAIFYKIFNRNEIKNVNLPEIHFYNAKKLHFKENYFDLVISQVSIQYVDRKDLLIEEVWRVLKKDGIAFLNVDVHQNNLPDFLNYKTPRFIIYKNKKIYPLKELINSLRRKGYNIRYKECIDKKENAIKRINLILKKNKTLKLKLDLKFDEVSSFNINVINEEKDNWPIYWGYRSVYKI